MFKKYMDYIKDFLENTPKDIYEFSIILEDALVDDYDAMHEEQLEQLKYWLMKHYISVHRQSRV